MLIGAHHLRGVILARSRDAISPDTEITYTVGVSGGGVGQLNTVTPSPRVASGVDLRPAPVGSECKIRYEAGAWHVYDVAEEVPFGPCDVPPLG